MKRDDRLDPDELRAVEDRARKLLDRASAWDRFPTPIGDILVAAQLQVAPSSAFDPVRILSYIGRKTVDAAKYLKSAISKVFGIYDAADSLIHIDDTVVKSKQNFLKLHETEHHEIPSHRKLFRFFQDCEKTLDPEVADLFEREANNFARFALFQGDAYARLAAHCEMSIRTPMKLATKFGASVYASAREFARKNHRACVVYILEPIQFVEGGGAQAVVRRAEQSPSFERRFGRRAETVITLDDPLGKVLPFGRKMTRPTALCVTDKNGSAHECVAEAFDTTWNVIVLLYAVTEFTRSTIVMPQTCSRADGSDVKPHRSS